MSGYTSFRQPFNGFVALMKKSGSASALATATQITIPAVHAVPLNPDNNSYPGVVIGTSYPSERVKGMKTPTVSITACYNKTNLTAFMHGFTVFFGHGKFQFQLVYLANSSKQVGGGNIGTITDIP